MGRKTYEFGYKFGLEPGQPAYPHMEHYIFSENLAFASQHEKVHVRGIDLKEIDRIRQDEGVRLFGDSETQCSLSLVDTQLFEHGLQIMTYEVG